MGKASVIILSRLSKSKSRPTFLKTMKSAGTANNLPSRSNYLEQIKKMYNKNQNEEEKVQRVRLSQS